MPRGPLYQDGYRPQFSGHETFPLRYGWLKKAFDEVQATESGEDNKSVFTGDDAIARLGVGKNMVASMRHWAMASGVLSEPDGRQRIQTTSLGRLFFGYDGIDPYMESPDTSWLIHWQLSAHPFKTTTWFWAFNHYPALYFERDMLARGIEKLARGSRLEPCFHCNHKAGRILLRSDLCSAAGIASCELRGRARVATDRTRSYQAGRQARRI